MITDFLMEHSALVPVAMIVVAVACVTVGISTLRNGVAGRRADWLLAGLALLGVFAFTLLPTPGTFSHNTCTVQSTRPSLDTVELLANVALFFPLVYFATLASRRPILSFLFGAALSAVIEALQAAAPDIGRSCDTNDWLMNTTGAAAGVVFALGTILVAGRKAKRRR